MRPALVLLALVVAGCAPSAKPVALQVPGGVRQALLCTPRGSGPFPAVVFHHGSAVDGHGYANALRLGYRLDRVCEALAEEGWIAFAPIREATPRGPAFAEYEDAYLDVAARAIEYVKSRRDVDRKRVALMGFSMGGLVSLRTSVGRTDLAALVLLAPAWGVAMQAALGAADRIQPPVLVMVEASDSPQILNGVDRLHIALRSHGREVKVVRYDRGGGHRLFWDLAYWWPDVQAFLAEKLKARAGP